MYSDHVNIAYSSSDLYALCTGVSLLSLLHNNQDITHLTIYIIDTDISLENKIKLKEISNKYNRSLVFIAVKGALEYEMKKLKFESLRGSYNTYSRLKLLTWFPNIDRIIFIDSDTLVVGSIIDLWNTDIDSFLMGAVPEIGVYLPNSTYEDEEIVNKNDLYFNAGIAIFNLKKWKKDNINDLIKLQIEAYGKRFLAAEQSVLNYSIGNKVKKVHLKYNYYTFVHRVSYRTITNLFSKKIIFSNKEFYEARKKPIILHFVGFPFERPWFSKSVSPYKKIYREYWKMSPWKTIPLKKIPKQNSLIFTIYDGIIRILKLFMLYTVALKVRSILGQKVKKIFKKYR